MSFVFRKSMFGFNKEDVLACVNELLDKTAAISGELESERKSHSEKEADLKNRLSDLGVSLNDANSEIARLQKENEQLTEEVREFRNEKEKLERLGEIIGKLYLVSKMNAEQIARSAKESRLALDKELETQLAAAEKASERLSELARGITDSSTKYTGDLAAVSDSLTETKKLIGKSLSELRRSEKALDQMGDAAAKSISER